MSRSIKKSTAGGNCGASSEAYDKKQWHRSHRRRNKVIADGLVDEDAEFVDEKQVSDPWTMAKDGKSGYLTDVEMRKRINAELTDILNGNLSVTRHWYASGLMKYYNLKKPENLTGLSSAQVEEYIRVYLKKLKRK